MPSVFGFLEIFLSHLRGCPENKFLFNHQHKDYSMCIFLLDKIHAHLFGGKRICQYSKLKNKTNVYELFQLALVIHGVIAEFQLNFFFAYCTHFLYSLQRRICVILPFFLSRLRLAPREGGGGVNFCKGYKGG